ncbi:unnamed protein product, partial [Meganyctiphanes norvegica]
MKRPVSEVYCSPPGYYPFHQPAAAPTLQPISPFTIGYGVPAAPATIATLAALQQPPSAVFTPQHIGQPAHPPPALQHVSVSPGLPPPALNAHAPPIMHFIDQ